MFSSGYIQPFGWLWLFTLHTALWLAVAVYLGCIQPFYFNRSIVSFGSGSQVAPPSAPPPAPITGGSCHKYLFGRNKSFLLSQQKYTCHDKTLVMTNIILSWPKFCCNNLTFVATKLIFCRDRNMLVTTNPFSWQTRVCRNKYLSRQKAYCCGNKRHVLWRQTQTHVCCNKTFVAAEIILLAAPANDRLLPSCGGVWVSESHWH